jgi:hypothetical protein
MEIKNILRSLRQVAVFLFVVSLVLPSVVLRASPAVAEANYSFGYSIIATGTQHDYPNQSFKWYETTYGQESWIELGVVPLGTVLDTGIWETKTYRFSPPKGFTITNFLRIPILEPLLGPAGNANDNFTHVDPVHNQLVVVVQYGANIQNVLSLILTGTMNPSPGVWETMYSAFGYWQFSAPVNSTQSGVGVVNATEGTKQIATINLTPPAGPHGGHVGITNCTVTSGNTAVTTNIVPQSTTATVYASTSVSEPGLYWGGKETGNASVSPSDTDKTITSVSPSDTNLNAPNGDTSWVATSNNPNVIVWMVGNSLHARAAVPADTTTAAADQTATYRTGDQSLTLSAIVTPAFGAVNGGNVAFTVKNGNETVGSASVPVSERWSAMSSGTTDGLGGIWGSSATDVFAVGVGGTILHYDGSKWSAMTSGTTNYLAGIWGTSHSDVYAVGYGGTILHYDGTKWNTLKTDSYYSYLRCIWGSNDADIFAAGETESGIGFISYYDGTNWTQTTIPVTSLSSIWGSSHTNVFAGGENDSMRISTISHFDGSSWTTTQFTSGLCIKGVWGSSAMDVYAVGDGGTILHYDGSTWSTLSSGTTQGLTGVWGSSASDIYAVGSGGTILHCDGSAWSALSSGTTLGLTGVWGSSATDAFAVGNNGTILHYDGSAIANASLTLPGGTPAGTYTIEADYSDGAQFNSSSDTAHSLTINKANTTITSVDYLETPTFSASDQSLPVSATVSSTAGPVSEGNVTFKVMNGDVTIGSAIAPVSNGQASGSLILPGGTPVYTSTPYTFQTGYSGSNDFNSSNYAPMPFQVKQAYDLTTPAAQTATYSDSDQNIIVSANVTSAAGPVNEGQVTFSVYQSYSDGQGGGMIGTAVTSDTVSGGTAYDDFILPGATPAGTYYVIAQYNDGYQGNFRSDPSILYLGGMSELTVSPESTKLLAADAWGSSSGTVNVWASLNVGTGVGGETIHFSLNGVRVGDATTGDDGWAELQGVSLSGIADGPHPGYITASIDDPNYAVSSVSGNLTVGSNTPTGSNVLVNMGDVGSVTFANVMAGGITAMPQPDPTVPNFQVIGGSCYDITTTATYSGSITISLNYDPAAITVPANQLKILHLENGQWVDVTTSVDTVNHIITGEVTSLSPFVLVYTPSAPTGPLDHFTMTGYPSTVTAGTNFGSNNVVVTAYDANGNIRTDYTGQVYFTSTDGQAVLPYTLVKAYTFTSGTGQDNGVHTFAGSGFTLQTVGTGSQTITVTDGTKSITVSINVNQAPASISIDPTTLSQNYGFTGPVTATTVPSGLSYSVTYAGSAAEPTNAGSYAVVATITDPNYTPATDSKTLVIAPASLTITANDEIKICGTTFTFDGTTEFTPSGLMNSDTVTFVTLTSAGALSSAPVGTYPIVPSAAVGTGLSNYTITYVNSTMTVIPPPNGKSPIIILWSHPNPSVYGQPVTFTAAVFGGFKNIPTGKATFKNGTAVLGTGTLDKFGLTSIKTSALPIGRDTITAAYSGDSIYASGTSIRGVVQLVQYDTTITLSSAPDPSTLGGAVLFTAQVNVTSPGTGPLPGGIVTFYSGSKSIGTCSVSGSGAASLSYSRLPAGSNSIRAVYSGSGNYESSKSNTVIQIVSNPNTGNHHGK